MPISFGTPGHMSSINALASCVDVRSYGAKGDGVTDDKASIQAALTAAQTAGMPLFLSPGEYRVTSGFEVTQNGQQIVCAGRDVTTIRCDGDFDLWTFSADYVQIKGGTFVGGATDTSSETAGILITDCTRGRFEDCLISDFGYGISMEAATSHWGNNLFNLYLYDNSRAGVYSPGHATTLVGCEIAGSVYGVLNAPLQAGATLAIDRDSIGGGQAVTLVGCTIEGWGESHVCTATADNGAGLVRVTCAAHGYQNGDFIAIEGTNVDGVYPIARISDATFDLLTSTFVLAWSGTGTASRGVALYCGNGTMGVSVSGGYFEAGNQAPVVCQLGDAHQNDGVTDCSGQVYGGCFRSAFFNAGTKQASFLVPNRAEGFELAHNYVTGTKVTLVNTRDANWSGLGVAVRGNAGISEAQRTTPGGTRACRIETLNPMDRAGGIPFAVQLPTTLGGALDIAFQVGGTLADSVALLSGGNHVFAKRASFTSGADYPSDVLAGLGSPEATISAKIGSLYLRADGGAGTCLYVKEAGGTGNTGWVAK